MILQIYEKLKHELFFPLEIRKAKFEIYKNLPGFTSVILHKKCSYIHNLY